LQQCYDYENRGGTMDNLSLELLIQIGILGCLIVLVIKAYEIRDNLESLNVKVGTGIDKIIR
tara:strand:+ start:85 stop:270 length:186 start_codon:yes stop_codon:yes gene_type:complete